MKVNGKIIYQMDMGEKFIRMVMYMKEISKMAKDKEKELIHIKMEAHILENGKMIIEKALGPKNFMKISNTTGNHFY